MANYWLGVDLGATNARFQLLDAQGLAHGPIERQLTKDLGDGSRFAAQCRSLLARATGGRVGGFAGVCLAVAGPVIDGRTRMTNGSVVLDADTLRDELRCPVLLCNDFYALAHGLDDFCSLYQLGGGAVDPEATRAVLGPGSGLGMALCPAVPADGQRQVIASEGGYGPLAPVTAEEAELCKVLLSLDDYLCWESVLSGPGLERLHQGCALLRGRTPEPLSAAEISERALAADPACRATVDQFFAFLGSCAGSLAVTACASGGVYLAGGILPRLRSLLSASSLRSRFDARGRLSNFVVDIPLLLVLDEEPGLLGAAAMIRRVQQSHRC